jgi:hypothetical protein
MPETTVHQNEIIRLLDALTYIAIAGAAAIFALLGYKPDGRPPEPPPA